MQELDFGKELRNQNRMYEAMKHEANVKVPRPFSELSSTRVITTEYLRGTLFSDLIRFTRRGDFDLIKRLGFDTGLLAERLIETALHQIFRLRFFHADLHPGNMIALPGNVIGLVDFGLTDVLDPSVEHVQTDYLTALYNNDTQGMYRAISQIFIPTENTNAEAFRRDFFAETSRWLALMQDYAANGAMRSPSAGYMVTLLRLTRLHEMRPPAPVLSMYRTLLTSESVANHLGSEANLRDTGRNFFKVLQLERLIESYHPDRALTWLMQVNELVRSGLPNSQQLLSDLADGRFVLSVRSHESEQVRHHANQRARLIALAILSTGPVVLLAMNAEFEGTLGAIMPGVLWTILVCLYAGIAIIWRRLD